MTTGQRIRDRRKALGLSADDLAKALGVSRSTVFRYENGHIEKVPSEVLGILSKVLQTTPAYLIGLTEEPESEWVDSLYDTCAKQAEESHKIIHSMKRPEPSNPKLAVLFSRSRKLTNSQLDIINSLIADMTKEQDGHDD